MLVLGMGLLWGGYTVAFYGYCLLRGYAVTLGQVINPTATWVGPGGLTSANTGDLIWPPGPAADNEVIPTRAGSVAGSVTVGPDGSVG